MDGAIPDFASTFGFDVPCSIALKNIGAPMFDFREDNIMVSFSWIWEIYSEDYSKLLAQVEMKDITLDFDMWIHNEKIEQ